MVNVYELYNDFRKQRLDSLKTEITAIVDYIRTVTNELPKDELINLFKSNRIKNITLKWTITQNKDISFHFKDPKDDVYAKVGKNFQFTSDCIENCNQMLKQFEYGLKIINAGWIYIYNGKMELCFTVEEGTLVKQINRFIEDVTEVFPDCEISNEMSSTFIMGHEGTKKWLYNWNNCNDYDYCKKNGWISITINA